MNKPFVRGCSLNRYREAELAHGRVCMLAATCHCFSGHDLFGKVWHFLGGEGFFMILYQGFCFTFLKLFFLVIFSFLDSLKAHFLGVCSFFGWEICDSEPSTGQIEFARARRTENAY